MAIAQSASLRSLDQVWNFLKTCSAIKRTGRMSFASQSSYAAMIDLITGVVSIVLSIPSSAASLEDRSIDDHIYKRRKMAMRIG
jgi:hypothetical protein